MSDLILPPILRACAAAVATLAGVCASADPMRPLVPPPAASGGGPGAPVAATGTAAPAAWPALTAVRQDPQGRWQALLADRWVGVGERVDGATVTAIAGTRIDLTRGGRHASLHLVPPLLPPIVSVAAGPNADAATPRRARDARSATP